MKSLYVALCVLGLVAPYWFFAGFVNGHGLDARGFVEQLTANPIAEFFAADVVVSSLVLWTFIYQETRTRRIDLWWLAIAANLVVGVSLAFPLFLLLRETAAERQQELPG